MSRTRNWIGIWKCWFLGKAENSLSSANAPAGYLQKNSSTNGKIESAQGTMGRGKRPLFSFSPSHRAPRALFFFLPSPPSTQRGLSGGKRGKPAEAHLSENEKLWRISLPTGSKPGVLRKEVTIDFLFVKSYRIQFCCSQLRFWKFTKLNLSSNNEESISLSCLPWPLGWGLRRQSDPDIGNWDQGENELRIPMGASLLPPVGVGYPSRHYNSFNE